MFHTNKKGFTMVELLVVLIIIGILAAVAAPLYLANTKRARMSEAVATASLVRQGLRDYNINNSKFFNIPIDTTDGSIQNPTPTSVNGNNAPTPSSAGVDVQVGVSQYFSSSAFSVDAGDPGAAGGAVAAGWNANITAPHNPVGFVIRVNGNDSEACASASDTNCAIKEADIATYDLEMDNSGLIFVSYDNGTTWSAY